MLFVFATQLVSHLYHFRMSDVCAYIFPGCRTGEAKMTEGFNLAARFIIHTVGPKYKAKYRTAAESSLYSCYRNVMQLAK